MTPIVHLFKTTYNERRLVAERHGVKTQASFERILQRMAEVRLEKVIQYGESRYTEEDHATNCRMVYSDLYRKWIRTKSLSDDYERSPTDPEVVEAYRSNLEDLAAYALMGLQLMLPKDERERPMDFANDLSSAPQRPMQPSFTLEAVGPPEPIGKIKTVEQEADDSPISRTDPDYMALKRLSKLVKHWMPGEARKIVEEQYDDAKQRVAEKLAKFDAPAGTPIVLAKFDTPAGTPIVDVVTGRPELLAHAEERSDFAPFLPKIKIEQVALYTQHPQEIMDKARALGITGWTRDTVVAQGYVWAQGELITNVAELHFNYELIPGVEFELLTYSKGAHWHIGRPDSSLSHFGTHVTNLPALRDKLWREWRWSIAQEVLTESHTNETIASTRRYHYCIFDTRHVLGFDLKLIERLPVDHKRTFDQTLKTVVGP